MHSHIQILYVSFSTPSGEDEEDSSASNWPTDLLFSMRRTAQVWTLVVLLLSAAVLTSGSAAAQNMANSDRSDEAPSGFSQIDGTQLEPATVSYDATMTMQGQSTDLSSSETFRPTSTEGTETWTIVSKTEIPQGMLMDSLIVDRSTLLPIAQHQQAVHSTADLTYHETSVSGKLDMQGQTKSIDEEFDGPILAGGNHYLIALGTMPLEPGFSTSLRIFLPQQQTAQIARFEVTGTETIETSAGSFDTFVVDVNVGDGNVIGTLHLRSEAPHYVVKSELEQSTAQGTVTMTRSLSSIQYPSSPASGTR